MIRCTGVHVTVATCCNDRPLVLTCAALADITLYSHEVLQVNTPCSPSHVSTVSLISCLLWEANLILPKCQLNTHEEQKFIEFPLPKGIRRDLL